MGDSCSGFQHNKRSVYVLWSVEIRFLVYGLLLSKREYFFQTCGGRFVRLDDKKNRFERVRFRVRNYGVKYPTRTGERYKIFTGHGRET